MVALKKNSYKDLSDLFEDWKDKHKTECSKLCELTFPKDIDDYENFKESFCVDGKFDDKGKCVEILFICRESNVGDKAEKNGNFWMKNVISISWQIT